MFQGLGDRPFLRASRSEGQVSNIYGRLTLDGIPDRLAELIAAKVAPQESTNPLQLGVDWRSTARSGGRIFPGRGTLSFGGAMQFLQRP